MIYRGNPVLLGRSTAILLESELKGMWLVWIKMLSSQLSLRRDIICEKCRTVRLLFDLRSVEKTLDIYFCSIRLLAVLQTNVCNKVTNAFMKGTMHPVPKPEIWIVNYSYPKIYNM